MADEEKIWKCPSCGGYLQWSPSDQKLKCPWCGSVYDPSYFDNQEKQADQEVRDQDYQKGETTEEAGASEKSTDDTDYRPEDLRVYRCQNCGAEIITDKTTAATTCAYCGSPVVLMEQFDTEFRPRWVVPFRIDRNQVADLYKKYVKSRPLTPGAFMRDAVISKIKGVYIPFWLYDLETEGRAEARGERCHTFTDDRYIHTIHQVFAIRREGKLDIRELPVDSSSKTPDDAMDSIEPFNMNDRVPFRLSYLTGFYAERYDVGAEECSRRAVRRAEQSMHEEIMKSIAGYTSVQILNEQERCLPEKMSADYALLPVYLLSVQYSGKNYLFAINGQTGRIVGDVPVSPARAAGKTAVIFAILYVIGILIAMLLF